MPIRRDAEVQARLLAFGGHVRTLRQERDLTQEQLAHESALHRSVIGFIERGEREIGVTTLWPLAAALGVAVGDLVTFD